MATGTVKWFNDDKGFGFITPDDRGKDLFVHHTGINGSGFKSLAEGSKVTYTPSRATRAPRPSTSPSCRRSAQPSFAEKPRPPAAASLISGKLHLRDTAPTAPRSSPALRRRAGRDHLGRDRRARARSRCSAHAPDLPRRGPPLRARRVDGLEPGDDQRVRVALDGEVVWPEAGNDATESHHPHPRAGSALRIVFGSCRVAAPHEPPWSLTKDEHEEGREIDALLALAVRMRAPDPSDWPDLLVLLGDQVYADQVSPATKRYIGRAPPSQRRAARRRRRLRGVLPRSTGRPGAPADALAAVDGPDAMIFDDHDVLDDWNTSDAWVARSAAQPWWRERIIGALVLLLDLPAHRQPLPRGPRRDDEIYPQVPRRPTRRACLREFAVRGRPRAERRAAGASARPGPHAARRGRLARRARAGARPPRHARRRGVGLAGAQCTGDVDHLLIGTSLPFLLAPGSTISRRGTRRSAVGPGAAAARVGERMRQASTSSTGRRSSARSGVSPALLAEVARGERGPAPSTIVLLSGDVHHAYVAEATLPDPDVQSVVAS